MQRSGTVKCVFSKLNISINLVHLVKKKAKKKPERRLLYNNIDISLKTNYEDIKQYIQKMRTKTEYYEYSNKILMMMMNNKIIEIL